MTEGEASGWWGCTPEAGAVGSGVVLIYQQISPATQPTRRCGNAAIDFGDDLLTWRWTGAPIGYKNGPFATHIHPNLDYSNYSRDKIRFPELTSDQGGARCASPSAQAL